MDLFIEKKPAITEINTRHHWEIPCSQCKLYKKRKHFLSDPITGLPTDDRVCASCRKPKTYKSKVSALLESMFGKR